MTTVRFETISDFNTFLQFLDKSKIYDNDGELLQNNLTDDLYNYLFSYIENLLKSANFDKKMPTDLITDNMFRFYYEGGFDINNKNILREAIYQYEEGYCLCQ